MKYRLFVALELPRDGQQRLAEVVAELSAAVPRGQVRWVKADGIHLTLKFYGDVSTELVPQIEAGLTGAAEGVPPLRLRIEGLGVFPNPRRPQVVWAGLVGDLAGLGALQAAVEAMSAKLGFAREARAFTPHLTLGRVKDGLQAGQQMQLLDFIASGRTRRFGEYEADRLTLMRSDLRPTGAVYTALFVAPLGGGRVGDKAQVQKADGGAAHGGEAPQS